MVRARLWMLVAVVVLGATDASPLRAAEDKPTNYDDHIAAIFKRHCLPCHGDAKQEAGLNLASYASAINGGSGGPVLVAGRSAGSRLFQAITAEDPEERMPPKTDPLPKDQIALIKAWIDKGLRQNAGSAAVPMRTLGFTPTATIPQDGPPPLPENLPPVERAHTSRPFPILALASSPQAPLVAASAYEAIDFLEPVTKAVLGTLPFPEGEPHVLRFSRSGTVLLAAGGRPVQNGRAVLFDVKTGKRLAELGDESDAVLAADISADQRQVALGGSGRTVKVYSTETGQRIQTLVKHTDWITSLAYSPDGKLLASADRVGNIHLWDAESGGVVLPLSEHKAGVTSLAWRSDSQILASSGEDGLVVWWDVSKGWPTNSKADAHPPKRPPGVYGRIPNGVLNAAFGPKGELVTCGRDGLVQVWGSDGSPLKSFAPERTAAKTSVPGIRVFPLQAVFTFDGRTVVMGDSAGQLAAWSLDSP